MIDIWILEMELQNLLFKQSDMHWRHYKLLFISVRFSFYCLSVFTLFTVRFNNKNFTFCPPECIYVLCIYLKTNRDFFHIQHWLACFQARDRKCLMGGMNWMFYIEFSLERVWKHVVLQRSQGSIRAQSTWGLW